MSGETKGDDWKALLEHLLSTARRSGTALNLYRKVVALRGQLAAVTAEHSAAREDLARIGRLVGCDSLVGVEIHAAVEHVVRHELEAARDAAERAERERDDALAIIETRNAEHALAMERVRDLEARLEFADRGLKTLTDAGWELATERALLRAIIEGRTTPPTDAELIAHDERGALWAVVRGSNVVETCVMVWASSRDFYVQRGALRWWPLDADGRPCAWPTVTP